MPGPFDPDALGDWQAYSSLQGKGINPGAMAPAPQREAINAEREVITPGPPKLAPLQDFPGLSGDTAGNDDLTDGMNAQSLAMRLGAPYIPNATRTGMAPVEGAYEDYSPLVGTDPALYKDTFVTKPREIANAIKAGGEAEAGMASAASEFYKTQGLSQQQEMAVIQQHRAQRQAEIHAKQQQLEQSTQAYSNDLADRGQFWRNPGNVLAAFGAAIMTLGSDDHAIGVKIISQAINQDYAQRKGLADMHLGELRSNLSAYRQLAGDKDLGDRLGFAESQRIAAMELQRISSQFQGPIAKAKAAQISAALLKESQIQMMEVHRIAVHHNAQRQDPGIIAAHKTQGAAMSTGPQSYVQGKTSGGVGAQSGGFGNGAKGSAGGQTTGVAGPKGSTLADGFMSQSDRELLNKRSPGAADQIDAERSDTVRRVLAASGADPSVFNPKLSDSQLAARLTPQQATIFNKEMVKYHDALAEDNKEIGAAMQPLQPRLTAYRALGKDIQTIELLASSMKPPVHPNELLGQRYKQVFGTHNVKAIARFLSSGAEPTEAHEKQAREVDAAVQRFEQSFSKGVNAWVKGQSGAAVSEAEDKRNRLYIDSDHSWESIKGFHGGGSSDLHAEAKAAIGRGKSNLTKTAWLVYLGQVDPGTGFSPIMGNKDVGTSKDPEVRRAAVSKLLSPAQQKAALAGGK